MKFKNEVKKIGCICKSAMVLVDRKSNVFN